MLRFMVLLGLFGVIVPRLGAQSPIFPLDGVGQPRCRLAIATEPVSAKEGRRVFVLHSGVHTILAHPNKNQAALSLKQNLLKRGVPEADIIALESPFPNATWREMFPREGVLIYLATADPASRASHEGYQRLDKALQQRGISGKDRICWIGHSAGGQMGMTMANLAENLDKYPALARSVHPYQFEAVITLGTAVGSNPVPSRVQLRHYYSAGDPYVYALARHGDVVSESAKSKVCFRLCHDIRENARVRVFADIDHSSWCTEDQIINRILAEFDSAHCPLWRRPQAEVGPTLGLAQLLARSLESEWKISLEEHRH